MSWLVILSFVAALGFGLWIGRPRRFDQSLEEIDERLGEEGRGHAKVRRHRTVLNLLQKKTERASHERRRPKRSPFRMR